MINTFTRSKSRF